MEATSNKTRLTVHTLWTGGLDSTARIVELSRQNVVIQPYYIIDSTRASTPYEIKAMNLISNRIISDANTKAILNNLIIVKTDEIQENKEITSAWKTLNKKYGVGSQYDFLARYASQHNIILEVGIEKGDGRAQTSIHKESKMEVFENEIGNNYHIVKNYSSYETWTLYKHFTFPLWEKDKNKEVELMNSLNCGDIVDLTWFCHAPLFGKPCGHCNPCKDAKHYGFEWRLSKSRYYLWYILRPKQVFKSFIKLFI